MIDTTIDFIINLLYQLTMPSYLLLLLTLFVVVKLALTNKGAIKLSVLTLCLWILVCVAPVGQWLLQPLEYRYQPPTSFKNIKGIIVLGGGQRIGPIQNQPFSGFGQHSGRVIAALSLSQQHQLPIYFFGGQQLLDGKLYNESSAIIKLHRELNLTQPLNVDNLSKNTFENALNAKQTLAKQPIAQYLLITSAAHMPRSMLTFARAGLSPVPNPVNYMSSESITWFDNSQLSSKLHLIDYATHEWLGLVQYYLLGRSDELLPKKSP